MQSQTASPQITESMEPDVPLPRLMAGRRLYVAANRGPVQYHIEADSVRTARPAGGLVTALGEVARHAPMTWVATASGPGDRLIASHAPSRAAALGSPKLRFVVASEESLYWSYRRFANPILWFLQHGMWDLIRRPNVNEMMEKGWILGYRPVNEAFARAIEQEVRAERKPVILTQDYHLYLLPGMLRERLPGALLHHFTHIPWPGPNAWEPALPAIRRDLCRGILGADVAGFQTESSAANFLRCCERFVPEARVNRTRDEVWFEGRSTLVRAYPISVDPTSLRRLASSPETLRHRKRLRPLLGESTIVRVDRLDPSKNVALGFRAYGRLLERRPDLIGRVRFLAFLVPSRQTITEYRRYAREVREEIEIVNTRFGRDGWKPIEAFHEDNRSQALAAMALADVLLVNPIADGMNLVAKEGPIVSERDLVLVLSRECGAHTQLGMAALSIPPLDLEATTRALEKALEMPAQERRRRLGSLRAAVEAEDLSRWICHLLGDLLDRLSRRTLGGEHRIMIRAGGAFRALERTDFSTGERRTLV